MKPSIKIGVNVFVIRDGKLLLGKRKNAHGQGMWGLPGGHLEYGEKLHETAFRELREETGLSANEMRFIGVANNVRDTDEEHYLQIGFQAEGVRGEPALCEPERCEKWDWWALDKLPQEIFPPHRGLLELFRHRTAYA